MKKFTLMLLIAFPCCMMAAQPLWVVRAMNNIRRAIFVANKAKTIGRAVLVLGKCKNALPDDEIARLAQIAAKPNGLGQLNKVLGKANYMGRFGKKAGHIILQDTYLRIAVKNGRLPKKVAAETLASLGGTPGLTSLLSKINSTNFSQAKGHMRELEIALSAQKRGFLPVSLGQKFADGLKKGDTDLDVFLRKNGKNFAVESKAYTGFVPEFMVKADAESLVAFCKEVNNTIPVFCFETQPSMLSRYFLKSRGVNCIVGTPEEIAAKLDIISSIK